MAYGGRWDIAQACRSLAAEVAAGDLEPRRDRRGAASRRGSRSAACRIRICSSAPAASSASAISCCGISPTPSCISPTCCGRSSRRRISRRRLQLLSPSASAVSARLATQLARESRCLSCASSTAVVLGRRAARWACSCSRRAGRCSPSALSLVGAWEWAGFGGLRAPARAARSMPARSRCCWLLAGAGPASPQHCSVLLGCACAWWCCAFLWLMLAPESAPRGLALLCGVPVLVPAFVALVAGSRSSSHGADPRPADRAVAAAAGDRARTSALFSSGGDFGRRKLAPRVSPGQDLGGRGRRACATVALVACGGAALFGFPALPVQSPSAVRSASSRWSAI